MDLSIRPCELFTKLNPTTKEYFEKTQLKFDSECVILANSQCFNNPKYATFVARLSDPNDTAFFDMTVIAINDTNTIEKTIFVNSKQGNYTFVGMPPVTRGNLRHLSYDNLAYFAAHTEDAEHKCYEFDIKTYDKDLDAEITRILKAIDVKPDRIDDVKQLMTQVPTDKAICYVNAGLIIPLLDKALEYIDRPSDDIKTIAHFIITKLAPAYNTLLLVQNECTLKTAIKNINVNITDLNAKIADLNIHNDNFAKFGQTYAQNWLTVLYAMNYLGNELGMIYDTAYVARPH